jgi:hypothetical protein
VYAYEASFAAQSYVNACEASFAKAKLFRRKK